MATKTFTQFRKDSVVTSIPVSLPYGEEAYYKDTNGRLTLYVGDESGDAQLAVPNDFPARIVNVFGGAPNVAPNYDTVAGAITYANSLTPSTANPVVIRLFSKANNTPYDLTGQDFFTLNASGIYVQSSALGYIDAPVVTTLPTTLEAGRRVWYKDANGVLTEWVGNESDVAQPVMGNGTVSFTPTFTVADAGTITALGAMSVWRVGQMVFFNSAVAITTSSPLGSFEITNVPATLRPSSGSRFVSWRYNVPETEVRVGMAVVDTSGTVSFDSDGSALDGQTVIQIFGSYAI